MRVFHTAETRKECACDECGEAIPLGSEIWWFQLRWGPRICWHATHGRPTNATILGYSRLGSIGQSYTRISDGLDRVLTYIQENYPGDPSNGEEIEDYVTKLFEIVLVVEDTIDQEMLHIRDVEGEFEMANRHNPDHRKAETAHDLYLWRSRLTAALYPLDELSDPPDVAEADNPFTSMVGWKRLIRKIFVDLQRANQLVLPTGTSRTMLRAMGLREDMTPIMRET